MTVLLILATFVLFLAIDYFYSKRHAVKPILAEGEATPRSIPSIVAGFRLPENLRYHPGHSWALAESPNLVRMGLDDFAVRLSGKITHMELPKRGQWVRQGQPVATLYRDGSRAQVVSPIEGMVTDVNDMALRDPEAVRRDPYGDGWLLAVQSPDAKTSFRNLLGGAVARKWMEEAAARLRMRLPQFAGGATLQDGGLAVTDITAELPDENWAELAREFFLS